MKTINFFCKSNKSKQLDLNVNKQSSQNITNNQIFTINPNLEQEKKRLKLKFNFLTKDTSLSLFENAKCFSQNLQSDLQSNISQNLDDNYSRIISQTARYNNSPVISQPILEQIPYQYECNINSNLITNNENKDKIDPTKSTNMHSLFKENNNKNDINTNLNATNIHNSSSLIRSNISFLNNIIGLPEQELSNSNVENNNSENNDNNKNDSSNSKVNIGWRKSNNTIAANQKNLINRNNFSYIQSVLNEEYSDWNDVSNEWNSNGHRNNNFWFYGIQEKVTWINSIRENQNKLMLDDSLKYNQFISLPHALLFKILNFLLFDFKTITYALPRFDKEIKRIFYRIFKPKVQKFNEIYENLFTINKIEFKFIQTKTNNSFLMLLPVKVISKQNFQRYYIRYKYNIQSKYKKPHFNEMFIIDITDKLSASQSTILTIETYYYKSIKRFHSYTEPVLTLTEDDLFYIPINLITNVGVTNYWEFIDEIKVENWNQNTYAIFEKTGDCFEKDNIDMLRISSYELRVNLWSNVSKIKEQENKYSSTYMIFLNLYKEFFKLKSVVYDNCGIFVYKIKWIAHKAGIVKKNKFVAFDVIIWNQESNVIRESVSYGWINCNSTLEKYHVRIQDCILVYWMQPKV